MVEQRLESERRQAEEKERQREAARIRPEAESTVGMAISHVDEVLRELEQAGEVAFDGFHNRWEMGGRMREKVGPMLEEELLRGPDLTREAVRKRIGALMRENLDAVAPD